MRFLLIFNDQLSKVKNELAKTEAQDTSDVYYKEIAFEEIDELLGKVKGATSYKAINSIKTLTNTEKHILEKVHIYLTDNGVF